MSFRKYLESLSSIKEQDKETLDYIGDPYMLEEISKEVKCFFCSEISKNINLDIYDPTLSMSAKLILVHEIKTEKCRKSYNNLDKGLLRNEIDYIRTAKSYSLRLKRTIEILNKVKENNLWMHSIILNYDV